jgi:hypothetical protein
MIKLLEVVPSAKWDAQTSTMAVKEGNFELLKWLVRNKCPVDESTTAAAAAQSGLSMLVFLRGLPKPVLKYAQKNGCPLDFETCAMAARNGHLNIFI